MNVQRGSRRNRTILAYNLANIMANALANVLPDKEKILAFPARNVYRLNAVNLRLWLRNCVR